MNNIQQYISISDEFLNAIEDMEWKVTPVGAYNDAEEIVDAVPTFKDGKVVKDSVDYYKMRLVAVNESDVILEDDEIYVLSYTMDKFKDLERRDRVKITLDRDALEVKLGKFDLNVKYFVSDISKVGI
ncbi:MULTISPECIES: hypothetical protein [Staphylococcus]|jgi:hypothetical protein|uniref:hypothetical protein n=1 Tax=Staphylococcus TaxID=1279 RepID=UPI000A113E11|nr:MULTISPECIES: hypothetical protein [Staphylococcus]MCM3053044.1 hypothetical protein [Staphylococcus warneri]